MPSSAFVAIKLIAVTTLCLGLAVLGICGITLSNTFRRLPYEEQNFSEEKNVSVWNTLEEEENLQESNTRFWENMSDTFRELIQGCTAAAIFCALVQLLISVIVVCTPEKKILQKCRIWQWTHFNLILLLQICILVPLSYNREKDSFRGSSSFAKFMKGEITGLYDTVSGQDQNLVHFFMTDLNSYYIILGVDSIVILMLLMISCCFTKCRCSDNYDEFV